MPRHVGARFLAGGLLCLIAWWLEQVDLYSADEMAAWYWCLVQNPLGPTALTPPIASA